MEEQYEAGKAEEGDLEKRVKISNAGTKGMARIPWGNRRRAAS